MAQNPVTGDAYICSHCGSPKLLFDAYAAWNVAEQQYDLHSTYNDARCESEFGSCAESCSNTSTWRVSADQDVQVTPSDDTPGTWMLSYAENHVFKFISEAKACGVQVEWRQHVGRDETTGELLPANNAEAGGSTIPESAIVNKDSNVLNDFTDIPFPIGVSILWGESPAPGDKPKTYNFDTEGELNAFLKGIEESNGWLDHQIVEEGYVHPKEE